MFSVINTLTRVKSSTEAEDVSYSLPSKKLKADDSGLIVRYKSTKSWAEKYRCLQG